MRARPSEAARYKIEPYVVAADVYSVGAPCRARGLDAGTRARPAWMYRAGIEGILGIRREGAVLVVDPCIPTAWPGFDATVEVGATRYDIRVETTSKRCRGISRALLDGVATPCVEGHVRVDLDGRAHRLQIVI